LDFGVFIETSQVGQTVRRDESGWWLILFCAVEFGNIFAYFPGWVIGFDNESEGVFASELGVSDSHGTVFLGVTESGDAQFVGQGDWKDGVGWEVDNLITCFELSFREDSLPAADDTNIEPVRIGMWLHIRNRTNLCYEFAHNIVFPGCLGTGD
jgi:hypothetical protein